MSPEVAGSGESDFVTIRSGKTVMTLKNLSTPSDADRLPNGNTIVAENGFIREFDRHGNEVWKKAITWAVEVNRY